MDEDIDDGYDEALDYVDEEDRWSETSTNRLNLEGNGR